MGCGVKVSSYSYRVKSLQPSPSPSSPPASPPHPARFALSRLSSVPSAFLLHPRRAAPLHVAGLPLHRRVSLSLGLGVCSDLLVQPARAYPRRQAP